MEELEFNPDYIEQCKQLGISPHYSKKIEYHGWNATIIPFYISDVCEKNSAEYFKTLFIGLGGIETHITKEKVKFKITRDSDFSIDRSFSTENEVIAFWEETIQEFERSHNYIHTSMFTDVSS